MDVLMPQLGETVAEGKITKWFKAAGDAVKPGDNLFEIETDKTSMEVPSTTTGTLSEIRFQVGEVAKVGAVVAVISGSGRQRAQEPLLRPLPPRRESRAQTPWVPACAATSGSSGKRQLCIPRRCRDRPSRWILSARCAHLSGIMVLQDLQVVQSSRRSRGGLPANAASI